MLAQVARCTSGAVPRSARSARWVGTHSRVHTEDHIRETARRRGQHRRALDLAREWKTVRDRLCSPQTYAVVMNACIKGGEPHLALRLYDAFLGDSAGYGLEPTDEVRMMRLKAFGRLRRSADALSLLQEARAAADGPLRLHFYGFAASAMKDAGDVAGAMQVLEATEADGKPADAVLVHELIRACAGAGDCDTMLSLLPRPSVAPAVDAYAFELVMDALSRVGRHDDVLAAETAQRERGLPLRRNAYLSVMRAAHALGEWEKASDLCDELESRRKEVQVRRRVIDLAIATCRATGRDARARRLQDMRRDRFWLPDPREPQPKRRPEQEVPENVRTALEELGLWGKIELQQRQ